MIISNADDRFKRELVEAIEEIVNAIEGANSE